MVLDASSLEAIAHEARACFLDEDVPEYQAELEKGWQQLVAGEDVKGAVSALMKTAHSLKGGAGIAQLPELSRLAHRLEDLLEALNEGRVSQLDAAYALLEEGIENISALIAAAVRNDSPGESEDLPIFGRLKQFLDGLPQSNPQQAEEEEIPSRPGAPLPYIVKTALRVDLQDCLQRLEPQLESQSPLNRKAIASFCEECTLLGETLNLPWLGAAVAPLQQSLDQGKLPDAGAVRGAIATIRQQREATLNPAPPPTPEPPAASASPTLAPVEAPLNLRMPLDRLDRINSTLGELLVNYERLALIAEQLQQASSVLGQRSEQLKPINDEVRSLYDQLATEMPGNSEDEASESEFDRLQLDRYSEFHLTLQSFQELMVQVQENRSDIDTIGLDFQESLEELRSRLNLLRIELTQARLVPFRTCAERFAAPLQTLTQRYEKSVQLVVEGEDTLVDRGILERLQTPLNHLFRNAFDHGIETPDQRRAAGKDPTALLTLTAILKGNRLQISVADDGRGINLQRVFEKAQKAGLCRARRLQDLSPARVIDYIFTPGFSTAASVNDLSGRGVGLDVVRALVERLRGTVAVETAPGQGSRFVISVPLTLSIVRLLLVRVQQHSLAIPTTKVLQAISLNQLQSSDEVVWNDRPLKVQPLRQLLPYQDEAETLMPPNSLALIVDVDGEAIAFGVDALVGERELVLKPFDNLVPVPPYLAGCTVLGTGEVIPVLDPDYLSLLLPEDADEPAAIAPPAQPEILAPGEPTVMVVDDSVAVRRTLERLLSQSGYQVVPCRDGKEALDLLNRPGEYFSMIISDIEMPRLDGFGLLQAVRSHSLWQSLPMVMLTSRSNERHRSKALELGATDYLGKPFRPDDLLEVVVALTAM